jgi:hypothetical protein
MAGPGLTRVALVASTRARIRHAVMVLLVKAVKVVVDVIIRHDVMVLLVKVVLRARIRHAVMVLLVKVAKVAKVVVGVIIRHVVMALVVKVVVAATSHHGVMIIPRNLSHKVSQSGARNAAKTSNIKSYYVK